MVLGLRSLSAILHPSNEPGKLPQWLCHDDNTINIVVLTLISTITYSRVLQPKYTNTTQYGQKYSRSGFVRRVHTRNVTYNGGLDPLVANDFNFI